MAERHVRAVQQHSKIVGDRERYILELLALDIRHDDTPAFTSYRKLAKRARCSVGFVEKCIKVAQNSGELVIQRSGRLHYYSLNPELIPYGSTQSNVNDGRGHELRFVTIEDLEQLKKEIVGELYQMYHGIVSDVSQLQELNRTKGKKERKEEEKAIDGHGNGGKPLDSPENKITTELVNDVFNAWNEFTPTSKCRATNSSRAKVRTRLKDAKFAQHYREAMKRGGKSDFLGSSNWYDFGWFVKNDDNWWKVHNGKFDNKFDTTKKPKQTLQGSYKA